MTCDAPTFIDQYVQYHPMGALERKTVTDDTFLRRGEHSTYGQIIHMIQSKSKIQYRCSE